MPSSETGSLTERATRGTRAAGFTLIELVVVMTIVSVLALTLIVGSGADSLFGRERNSEAASAARNFEQAINRARQTAFHTRLPFGVMPKPDGWLLLQRDREAGGWRAFAEGSAPGMAWIIDGTTHFPAPLPPDTPPLPRVVLASDGRSTPFSAEFHSGQDRFRCQSDGWEALQCARP